MNKKRASVKVCVWPLVALLLLLSPFSKSFDDDYHLIETQDISETKY